MVGDDLQEFAPPIDVRVARTLEDLQRIMVVRALVFMSEQDCPYDEEFDGNDLAGATHLIAEAAGEPLGALRLRWFSEFVKIERVVVRRHERSGRITRSLIRAALEIIRRKGYSHYICHVQAHLIPYWRRYGLIHRVERGEFVFADRAYAEMEGRIDLHPEALTPDSDPLVLDRPEGDWDRPGPLEASWALIDASPIKARIARMPDDGDVIGRLREAAGAPAPRLDVRTRAGAEASGDLSEETHLIAEIQGRALGCLSMRWIENFATIDHVCVPAAEGSGDAAHALVELASRLASSPEDARNLER